MTATTPRPTTPATDPLVSAAVAAEAVGVDPKTLTRWAKAGMVDCEKTLGGHRRYQVGRLKAQIEAHRAAQEAAVGDD